MARVEDLEVLVDLVSGGLTSLRADLRAVRRELAELQAVVGRPLQVTVAREQAEQAAADAGGDAPCACARASKTPRRPPRRACAPTRPDTHSSHARVDPSRAPPPPWRHARTSTGKRRDDRALGGRSRPRGRARPGRRPPRAAARVGRSDTRSRASLHRPRPRRRASTASSAQCSPARRAPMPTVRPCSTCARVCARGSSAPSRTRPSPRRATAGRTNPRRLLDLLGPVGIAIVDRAAEDDWVRDRFAAARALGIAELAGPPGALRLPSHAISAWAAHPADAFPPGRAAGDVVVQVAGGGYTEVVLRRRPERGLTVITRCAKRGGPASGGRR